MMQNNLSHILQRTSNIPHPNHLVTKWNSIHSRLTNIRHTTHCFPQIRYYPTAQGHRVLALMFVCSGIQIQNFSLSLSSQPSVKSRLDNPDSNSVSWTVALITCTIASRGRYAKMLRLSSRWKADWLLRGIWLLLNTCWSWQWPLVSIPALQIESGKYTVVGRTLSYGDWWPSYDSTCPWQWFWFESCGTCRMKRYWYSWTLNKLRPWATRQSSVDSVRSWKGSGC